MAEITLTPEQFVMTQFDGARIVALAADVCDRIGLPSDLPVAIEVDERTPLGRTRIVSVDPVSLHVEGGAFEDPKRLRQLSERNVQEVLGRLLLRVRDRRDPNFGAPPPDDELSLPQTVAWDAYAVGRAVRAGLPGARPRRLYHFRNRHGFTDVADLVFARLWDADGLTWADLDQACEETAAARESVA